MAEAPLTLPLIVRAQYIKDLSFENPNPLKAFTSESTEQPPIAVNIQAHAQNLSGGNFEVIMDIRVEAKRKEDVLFIAELSYGSIVSLENVADDVAAPFVMIETPHLMFPFARSIISDVIREGGFPPLLLSPVDFAALYRKQQEEAEAANDKKN